MLTNDGKLDELVRRAIEAFNALTPEQQRAHRREQAISWAKGQVLMSRFEHGHPDLSDEEVAAMEIQIGEIYDQRHLDKKDLSEE